MSSGYSVAYQPKVNDAVIHDNHLKRILYVDSEGVGYVNRTSYSSIVPAVGAKLVGKFKRRIYWFGFKFDSLEPPKSDFVNRGPFVVLDN